MSDPDAYRTKREWEVKKITATVPRAALFKEEPERGIEIYGDGIGRVDLVDHMGSDLTIVNSARVSFGKHKEELDEKDKRLVNYLVFALSIIAIALGLTMKYLVDILM